MERQIWLNSLEKSQISNEIEISNESRHHTLSAVESQPIFKVSPTGISFKKNKKFISSQSNNELEKYFEEDNAPVEENMCTIASKLGLQLDTVTMWFKNRRAIFRKKNVNSNNVNQLDILTDSCSKPDFLKEEQAVENSHIMHEENKVELNETKKHTIRSQSVDSISSKETNVSNVSLVNNEPYKSVTQIPKDLPSVLIQDTNLLIKEFYSRNYLTQTVWPNDFKSKLLDIYTSSRSLDPLKKIEFLKYLAEKLGKSKNNLTRIIQRFERANAQSLQSNKLNQSDLHTGDNIIHDVFPTSSQKTQNLTITIISLDNLDDALRENLFSIVESFKVYKQKNPNNEFFKSFNIKNALYETNKLIKTSLKNIQKYRKINDNCKKMFTTRIKDFCLNYLAKEFETNKKILQTTLDSVVYEMKKNYELKAEIDKQMERSKRTYASAWDQWLKNTESHNLSIEMDTFNLKPKPSQSFEWSETLCDLLLEAIRVKLVTFKPINALSHNNSLTTETHNLKETNKLAKEKFIKEFLAKKILILWPDGWMSLDVLYNTYINFLNQASSKVRKADHLENIQEDYEKNDSLKRKISLKSDLTCSYCSKIYKEPIELPCQDLLCKEHLTEQDVVQNNKIKCGNCKKDFTIKDVEFKTIPVFKRFYVQKQIEKQNYLSDEEISLKLNIEQSIHDFYRLHEKLSQNIKRLELDSNNHFQKLRGQLEIHRDNFKKKIDEIYHEMMNKTEKYETYLNTLNDSHTIFLKSLGTKLIDEKLKEIEDLFRNPNVLMQSIQEIQIKQEKEIKSIQLKLDELNQEKVNFNLKEIEFEPNMNFDENSFGSLQLKNFSRSDPFKSQILTDQQTFELIKLCEFSPNSKFKLLFRASEDGFDAKAFHSKCDSYANTLTIFKALDTSFIFGAFTTTTWESPLEPKHKSDPNAFLFSLTNKEKKPCKMKIASNQHQNAIYCNSGFGPTFGAKDIGICSNANIKSNSSTNIGYTYKHDEYAHNTSDAKSFLTGSHEFKLSEIEIYQKE